MIYFITVTAFAAGISSGIAATLIYWPWSRKFWGITSMSDLILWFLNPFNAVVWAFGCLVALIVVSIAIELIAAFKGR
jgi:hypothetical protein